MHFTESHEWILVDGDVGTVGITTHAQKELGEIVYIEFPKVGKQLYAAQEAAVLESTKAASDVYAPVAGEIIAINENLKNACQLINHSPEGEGWLFKIKLTNPGDVFKLMNRDDYLQLVK